jgi:hypothetical protein
MYGQSSILYPHEGEEDRGGPIQATSDFHRLVGRNKEKSGKNVLRIGKDKLVREVFCPSLKKGKDRTCKIGNMVMQDRGSEVKKLRI